MCGACPPLFCREGSRAYVQGISKPKPHSETITTIKSKRTNTHSTNIKCSPHDRFHVFPHGKQPRKKHCESLHPRRAALLRAVEARIHCRALARQVQQADRGVVRSKLGVHGRLDSAKDVSHHSLLDFGEGLRAHLLLGYVSLPGHQESVRLIVGDESPIALLSGGWKSPKRGRSRSHRPVEAERRVDAGLGFRWRCF